MMSTEASLQVSIVPSADMRDSLYGEVLSLCSRAYQEDFAWYLDLLSPAVHVLARSEGVLVSHVAWVERELRVEKLGPLRTAYVEAVATLPEYQGKGYATALLARIPALTSDFDLAVLSPSDERFYRRLGWQLWEGPLSYIDRSGTEVPTPEEQVMIYRLPRTPQSLDLRAKLTTDWRDGEVW